MITQTFQQRLTRLHLLSFVQHLLRQRKPLLPFDSGRQLQVLFSRQCLLKGQDLRVVRLCYLGQLNEYLLRGYFAARVQREPRLIEASFSQASRKHIGRTEGLTQLFDMLGDSGIADFNTPALGFLPKQLLIDQFSQYCSRRRLYRLGLRILVNARP